jgi:NtrC-family two-component system response regulator AlgB
MATESAIPARPMRVLVINDEKNVRTTLAVCLEGLDGQVTQAATSAAALTALTREVFELAFLDLRLGAESGLDLLPRLRAERPSLEVVLITAYATFDMAVEASSPGRAGHSSGNLERAHA